ncbi:Uncharacterised protein [Candidatus Anstonella stagnisolia]|nr:Uncharacterised protein [Candidatus Anstonella stagnisolia]
MDEAKPEAKEQKPVVAGDSKIPEQSGNLDQMKAQHDGEVPTEAPTPAEGTEEAFDAKAAIDGLQRGLEETNARLSQIWEFLESLEEEEEKEPEHMDEATKAAGTLDGTEEKPKEGKPPAPAEKPAPKEAEKPEEKKEAHYAKDVTEVATLRKEISELRAKFAKMEEAGVRKTVSSSTNTQDPVEAEMQSVWASMGDISKNGGV